MKNRIIVLFITFTAAAVLAGCGNQQATQSYREVGDLNAARSVTFAKSDSAVPQREIQLVSEGTGSAITLFTSTENLTVYNKPADDGAVLGTIKAGSDIKGIEIVSGSWCRISFNGRVAYIKPTAPLTVKDVKESETTAAANTQNNAVNDGAGVNNYNDGQVNQNVNTGNNTNTDNNNNSATDATQPATTDSAAIQPVVPVTFATEPSSEDTEPAVVPGEPATSEPSSEDPGGGDNTEPTGDPGGGDNTEPTEDPGGGSGGDNTEPAEPENP